MYPPVVTKDPTAVEVEVQAAYLGMFPKGDAMFVPRVFGWAIECFTGSYRDYQAVDARYHDFEHTLQGTLCMARLLRGRHFANTHPQLTQRMFQLGLLAILTHDTGYLKKRDDVEGTGAKYTVTHVDRSADFAAELLAGKNFPPEDIRAVQNMIHCTGVDAALSVIPFQNDMERIVGHALGTADLLGQMAAEDYVEKLPVLYAEFAEAAQFSKDKPHFISMFSSAADLMQKTPAFWDKYVQMKLNRDFCGFYQFLNDPYPHGPNGYLKQIEANMEKLRAGGSPLRERKDMQSIKELKIAEKSIVLQQQVVTELNTLVRDIERCEKTILDLQAELGLVNAKYPSPRTTRQDIGYLSDLLKCANKKLAWEKQIASMQKRTPATLEKMSQLLNDPKNPPADEMRVEMLRALQGVQAAMQRLQTMKAD